MFNLSKLMSFNSYKDRCIVINHADGNDYELNLSAEKILKKIERREENYSNEELEFIEDLINAGIVFKDGQSGPSPSCADNHSLESPLWSDLTADCAEKCIPLCAVAELTYRCQAECIHCYIDRTEIKLNEEMPFEKYSCFLDDFKSLGGLYLILTGGDPFLHKDFEKIFSYARKKRIAVSVMSSGISCDKELIKRLSDQGMMSFQASIHGHNGLTHDSFTKVKGSFEKTVRTLQLFKESGVYVQAAVSINRKNIGYFDDIINFLEKEKINYSFNFEMFPARNGDNSPVELNISEDQLFECLLKTGDPGKPRLSGKTNDDFPCNAARSVFSINPAGDVFPCIEIRECAGNIKNRTISDIWNNSDIFKKFRVLKIGDLSDCPECQLKEFCDRCHGNALRRKLRITDHSPSDCRHAEIRNRVRSKKDLH